MFCTSLSSRRRHDVADRDCASATNAADGDRYPVREAGDITSSFSPSPLPVPSRTFPSSCPLARAVARNTRCMVEMAFRTAPARSPGHRDSHANNSAASKSPGPVKYASIHGKVAFTRCDG